MLKGNDKGVNLSIRQYLNKRRGEYEKEVEILLTRKYEGNIKTIKEWDTELESFFNRHIM